MKIVNTEIDGKKYVVQVPDEETDYTSGFVIGPPDLNELGLPEAVERRLHNELFVRGLIRKSDILKRRHEIAAALQAAYAVDAEVITNLYK